MGQYQNAPGASQADFDALNSNLAYKLSYINIAGSINTTYTFNISNNYRGFMMFTRSSGAGGLYFIGSNSSGTVGTTVGISISDVSISTDTGKLMVTLASNSNIALFDIRGTSSQAS